MLISWGYVMSWNEYEYSTAEGQPVTLYEFVRGGGQYFRYTNADRNIIYEQKTWLAEAISDSGLSQNTGDNIDITVPATNPLIKLFRGVPPSEPVSVKISRFHYADDKQQLTVASMGTILEIKRQDDGAVKIITAGVASAFTRNGLRLTWGRSCPHALYDHNCRVNHAAFAVTGLKITDMTGAEIMLNIPAEVPENYFSGGYIEYETDGITERRGARTHSSNKIGLFGGTQGLKPGMIITAYPGCDKTIAKCNGRFNNSLNYGGVPHLPGISPYQIIKLF